VDVEGRLVGVPTAILSRTGGNVGIGFAVPVNMARTVVDLIVKHGRVVRGYLGVFVQSVTPGLKQAFKLPDRKGALVSGVAPNSPAAAGGLQEGDVITAMNGEKVNDSRHLRLLIAQNAPNTKVEISVWRGGQEKKLGTTLGELPVEQVASVPQKLSPTGRKTDAQLGLQLRNLDADIRQELKLPTQNSGVLVEGVDRSAPAYSAGLRPGDIILEVNRKPVKSAQEAFEATKAQANAPHVLFKVWSKGGSRFVVVETGEKEN
jgi:serine protease Do